MRALDNAVVSVEATADLRRLLIEASTGEVFLVELPHDRAAVLAAALTAEVPAPAPVTEPIDPPAEPQPPTPEAPATPETEH